MLAIVLAFGASLGWGSGDFIGGVKTRKLPLLTVVVGANIAALTLIGATFVIMGRELGSSEFVLFAALAGLGQLVGMAALYRALSTGAMGVAAPISATGVVIPLAVGIATGERLALIETIGICFAIAGVLLVSYQPSRMTADGKMVAIGVGMALLAALGFGGFYVLMDAASARGDIVSAVLVNRMTIIAVLAPAALIVGLSTRLLDPRDLRHLALIGALAVGGTLCFAAATTHGLLSLVAVVAALYPVATILLARFFLGERLARTQRVGAAAALVGVALISVG